MTTEAAGKIMSIRNQKLTLWVGLMFPIFYWLGWGYIAGYLPPSDPAASPDAIYQMYKENGVAIRVGMYICGICAIFLVPWTVSIWAQMRRIEDHLGRYPIISMTQFGAGILNVTLFLTPQCVWMATAFTVQYRPDAPAVMIEAMHDTGWVLWFTTICPAILQCFALGYMGLIDTRPTPIFPRWFCYFQFWAGVSTIGAGAVPFFNAGPFSWTGLVGCWIPVGVYGLWFPLTAYYMFKSINGLAEEEKSGSSRSLLAAGT